MIVLTALTGANLGVTFNTILAIFGAIAAVMAGLSAIAKMFSPFKELKAKVAEHDERFDDAERRFKKLEDQLESQSKMQREICKSLVVMMNHEITGNSIDKLKNQHEELQKFLIDN